MAEIEFNQMQLDILREICTVAGGNAATSLSIMSERKIDITVPNIMIEAVENVPMALDGEEKVVNAVYLSISGQISASIFLILDRLESLRMVDILTRKELGQSRELDEMGISALKELGNIMGGSYLTAIVKMSRIRITHSIPGFASDMLGALLDEMLAQLSLKTRYAVIVENEFKAEDDICIKGHFVLMLEPGDLELILEQMMNR